MQWAALTTGSVAGRRSRRRRPPRSRRRVAAPGTPWWFRRRHAPAYMGVRVCIRRRPPTSAYAARPALPGSVIGGSRAMSADAHRHADRCRCDGAAGWIAPFGAVAMPRRHVQCTVAMGDRLRHHHMRLPSLGGHRGRRQGRQGAQSGVRAHLDGVGVRSSDATPM